MTFSTCRRWSLSFGKARHLPWLSKWLKSEGQTAQKQQIYHLNMKQKVEIKSFPGAESPHLSRWLGRRDKSVTWKFLFCLECKRVMAWYQSKRDRKTEEVHGIIRVPSAAASPYAWQREILVTLFHTYGVEGGRWLPVGAKNLLSSTLIPSHKSVLSHPLFTDKAAKRSLVQGRKSVTSFPLRNCLSHTPILL